jgi:hypothetical protein
MGRAIGTNFLDFVAGLHARLASRAGKDFSVNAIYAGR